MSREKLKLQILAVKSVFGFRIKQEIGTALKHFQNS